MVCFYFSRNQSNTFRFRRRRIWTSFWLQCRIQKKKFRTNLHSRILQHYYHKSLYRNLFLTVLLFLPPLFLYTIHSNNASSSSLYLSSSIFSTNTVWSSYSPNLKDFSTIKTGFPLNLNTCIRYIIITDYKPILALNLQYCAGHERIALMLLITGQYLIPNTFLREL